jgi:hypothetical protein
LKNKNKYTHQAGREAKSGFNSNVFGGVIICAIHTLGLEIMMSKWPYFVFLEEIFCQNITLSWLSLLVLIPLIHSPNHNDSN